MKFQEFFNYDDPSATAHGAALVFLPQWSDSQWEQLLEYTEFRYFEPGDLLMSIGEVERSLYIMVEGQAEVLIPHQNGETLHPIGIRETGAVIGEQAFIDESPRSATVRALTAGSAMRLSWSSYEIHLMRLDKPNA